MPLVSTPYASQHRYPVKKSLYDHEEESLTSTMTDITASCEFLGDSSSNNMSLSPLNNQKKEIIHDDCGAGKIFTLRHRSSSLFDDDCFQAFYKLAVCSNHFMINQERVKCGLPAMVRNSLLDSIAREHADRLAEAGRLFHSAETAEELRFKLVSGCGERTEATTLLSEVPVGENIQCGDSIRSMHQAVMENDDTATGYSSNKYLSQNRANIFNAEFTEFGMGTSKSRVDGKVYMVQLFLGSKTTEPTNYKIQPKQFSEQCV